jgi:hypothetical protein
MSQSREIFNIPKACPFKQKYLNSVGDLFMEEEDHHVVDKNCLPSLVRPVGDIVIKKNELLPYCPAELVARHANEYYQVREPSRHQITVPCNQQVREPSRHQITVPCNQQVREAFQPSGQGAIQASDHGTMQPIRSGKHFNPREPCSHMP